jgi:4-amino-4-deoxy-L-arabinose transferase-like glycosyltransferase
MLGTIMLFLGMRREWSAIRRTIWIPGLCLYLLMVLPWYIEVQRRNPHFFRIFFLEHNIERFATDRYQHSQHWFYYVVVLIIALLPWTALALRALWDGMALSVNEWKVRHKPQRYVGHMRAGDAFPEFLVLWALLPVVFFSFSVSKLPGYILPSMPPLAILTGDYLFRIRRAGLPLWLLNVHAGLTGFMTFVILLCPQYMIYQRIIPAPRALIIAAGSGIAAGLFIIVTVRIYGVRRLRAATLVPLMGLMFFLLGMNGHLLDLNYSARPLARAIKQADPGDQVVAVHDVRRDLDYGLAFYRDQNVIHYDTDGVPDEGHILVLPTREAAELPQLLPGRTYQQLFLYNTQGLSVYKVYPRG